MNAWNDLKMYWRFARGLKSFADRRITAAEAAAIVQKRLAERESNFLRIAERGIFGYPRSPYLPLLKLAGCEFGDLRNTVRSKGLESALHALREAGVYFTFEEYKGREPVVRNGKTIRLRMRDFDNPRLRHCYEARSGASTGVGTRAPIDLDQTVALLPLYMVAFEAHGALGLPTGIWRGILPDSAGINNILQGILLGQVPQKWFTPITSRELRPSLKYRLATEYFIRAVRSSGIPIPTPEPVRLDQAVVVARWAAGTAQERGQCLIRAHVGMATRVALAAREVGLDLRGTVFMGGGEPPTPAKVKAIESTGARLVPSYVTAETGPIGYGCVHPADENDQHFYKDAFAVIQFPREVPGAGIKVNAFSFTTLLATAPKLMLNVESDDYGTIERRPCGCPLEKLGLTEHLRGIRSFRKLTGDGVTLVGSEMLHVLEEVLPARFGGGPLDYQAEEEENEQGLTQLSLVVSPRVGRIDEAALIDAVLNALRNSSVSADMAGALWRQAGTLRVKRSEPVWTARGKLIPLHLTRNTGRQGT